MYTGYAVPTVQIEGSGVFVLEDLEEIKSKWYSAIEIFETPGETTETLKSKFNTPNAEQGVFCKFLRANYKMIYKDGKFWFDKEK